MATSLVFTDDIGAATLNNGKPVPGDRFANWTQKTSPIGESAFRLSDGALSMFRFRIDYGASFELRAIPSLKGSGTSLVDCADRLCYWLLNGGTVRVNTGDVDGAHYDTCGLMPGTTSEVRMSDPQNLEYTLSLSLINLAGSPARMVCRYADQ